MSGSKTAKIAISTLVLGLAFSAMLYSSLSEDTQYYKHVDEVMTQPAEWYGKRLQLHGFVVPKTVFVNKQALEYQFQVQSNGRVVTARYTGVVPDTFKDDAEVVLKGTLSADGFAVSPNGVVAKCPSKYEPKPGAPTTGTR